MAFVKVRIDDETKDAAFEAFEKMGLTASAAVRLFFRRVADDGVMPFEVRVPSAETLEAMKELDEGRGRRFATVADFMDSLNEAD